MSATRETLAEIEAAQERDIRDRVPLPELQKILVLKKGGKSK
jgi:hypothetical protein